MRKLRKSPSSSSSSSTGANSTIAEIFVECLSKHRSCWLHLVVNRYNRKKKLTLKEIKMIKKSFGYTSPCFLQNLPQGKRSKRMGGLHSTTSKIRKKLDTETFECYMEALWKSFSEEKRMPFTCLDSLWFSLYRNAETRPKVLSWIKQKCIFSKNYVFVPVVCWSHWSLLILVHFGDSSDSETRTPCMLLLDSLESADPRRLEPEIRKFIADIYRIEGIEKDKRTISRIPLLIPKVPQQRDDEECGSYVLYFINLFMQLAPENFSHVGGYPYFMERSWFNLENLDCFRKWLEKELSRSRPVTKKTGFPRQKLHNEDGVILLDD